MSERDASEERGWCKERGWYWCNFGEGDWWMSFISAGTVTFFRCNKQYKYRIEDWIETLEDFEWFGPFGRRQDAEGVEAAWEGHEQIERGETVPLDELWQPKDRRSK